MVQYAAESPAAYLAELADDWRKARLINIRDAILELVPDVRETVGYGMLRFERGTSVFCHLNAQKSFVGLYLGDVAQLDPDGHLTDDLNVGKGCVRVRKRDRMDAIRLLIERKAKLPPDEAGC